MITFPIPWDQSPIQTDLQTPVDSSTGDGNCGNAETVGVRQVCTQVFQAACTRSGTQILPPHLYRGLDPGFLWFLSFF